MTWICLVGDFLISGKLPLNYIPFGSCFCFFHASEANPSTSLTLNPSGYLEDHLRTCKWLGSPSFMSQKSPFGTTRSLRDLPSPWLFQMAFLLAYKCHLLTGMILQVAPPPHWKTFPSTTIVTSRCWSMARASDQMKPTTSAWNPKRVTSFSNGWDVWLCSTTISYVIKDFVIIIQLIATQFVNRMAVSGFRWISWSQSCFLDVGVTPWHSFWWFVSPHEKLSFVNFNHLAQKILAFVIGFRIPKKGSKLNFNAWFAWR